MRRCWEGGDLILWASREKTSVRSRRHRPSRNRLGHLLTGSALPVLLLLATACVSGQDDTSEKVATMARADWTTGYFQAYIYAELLEELGYEVNDPAEFELGPSLAYLGMAEGDIDFWVNSWYPLHDAWMEPELPDGSLVGDHLTVVGDEMREGGPSGFMITKAFADEFNITTLDDLNSNHEALARFDASDPDPGNGVADVYSCPQDWTCDDVFVNMIAFSGWENIQGTIAGYEAMMAEAVAKVESGEPMAILTWSPSPYIADLRPGDNVYWLGVDNVLDDSNPAGLDGGEGHDQRPGTMNVGADQCPQVAEIGVCQVGMVVNDILVTANSEWLDSHPDAAKLLEAVELPVVDVVVANIEQANGRDTSEDIRQLAVEWIEKNRSLVDQWLAEARSD